MAKKKSIRLAAIRFCDNAGDIVEFGKAAQRENLKDEFISWAYDYAIIKLYREFESLMFDALVGAINNDTKTISASTGYSFPEHLNEEICRFLVTGTAYFDFRGRAGLIKTLKNFVPPEHYLIEVVKARKYKESLEQLVSLRNFAAHSSKQSKNSALEVIGQKRMSSSGAWLKRQSRLEALVDKLKDLAMEVHGHAPY